MSSDMPDMRGTDQILELPLARGFVAREGRILARGREASVLPWQSQTNNNMCVIGGSGSGKTESVIVPNIMQCDSSYLVVDVKGALLPRLGPGLRAAGYEVRAVDLVFPDRADASVNPMARCVRPDGTADPDAVHAFAVDVCSMSGTHMRNGDAFWYNSAVVFTKALTHLAIALNRAEGRGRVVDVGQVVDLLALAGQPSGLPTARHLADRPAARATRYDPEQATYDALDRLFDAVRFGSVPATEGQARAAEEAERAAEAEREAARDAAEEFREGSYRALDQGGLSPDVRRRGRKAIRREQQAERTYVNARDRARRVRARVGMPELAPDPGCEAVRLYDQVRKAASRTWMSVLVDTKGRLARFDAPGVRRALSSELAVDPAELGRRPMALFLHTSDTSSACDFAVAALEHEALDALTREADARPDRRLAQPVTLVLDDFASGAVVPDFERFVAAARSRDIRITVALQSMDQLAAMYGAHGARTILANCDTQLFLGVVDLETASYVAGTQRVVDPCDVLYAGVDTVFGRVKGHRPFRGHRYDWHAHPNAAAFVAAARRARADER